jgi:hypothetical protein
MKPTNDEIVAKASELRNRDTKFEEDRIDLVNWAMDKALEGMVPAGESIKLDWPDGAAYATAKFFDVKGTYLGGGNIYSHQSARE